MDSCGVVVIGRNEGQRLRTCLTSLSELSVEIVYVDSGSTDGSVDFAISLDVEVILLDMSQPFTAARARNAGATQLMQNQSIKYLQFIDGDCEINNKWMSAAYDFLNTHDEYAVVCGRLRERFPEKSIYNRLCDLEWDTPIGDVDACGGITMIRADLFELFSGFQQNLIAGEEPELCLRFRGAGWKIRRLGVEMALHDANMLYFRQWWRRTKRSGYACAEGYYMYKQHDSSYMSRELIRIIFWALILPLILFSIVFINPVLLLLSAVYPLQILRIAIREDHRVKHMGTSFGYGFFNTVGKFAQLSGVIQFVVNKLKGKTTRLIEYKQ